jgi:hypothetical protein
MEFVNVEGERIPYVMYKPFVYSSIVDCSNHFTIFCPNGEVKQIIKTNKEYGKEIDVLLRDPKRIVPFLEDIAIIWTYCCPDWRFGQVIENVFGEMDYVPFMLEEDRMVEEFVKYFKVDKKPELMKQLNIYKKKHPEKKVRT